MFNKSAFKGFAIGALAAAVVVLGAWPVLANNGDQLMPANYELDRMPGRGDGLGTDEEGEIGAAGGVVGQAFGGRPPLVIPAAAFTSHGDNVEDYFFSSQVSGFFGYIRQDGTGSVCLQAPAYLPAGATVTSVYGYLYDNHSSGDVWVDLYRVRNLTGAEDTMASVSTTGFANSTSIRYLGDTTITEPAVSDLYSYYVFTCFPSDGSIDLRLYAVRIFYSTATPVYLPAILRDF